MSAGHGRATTTFGLSGGTAIFLIGVFVSPAWAEPPTLGSRVVTRMGEAVAGPRKNLEQFGEPVLPIDLAAADAPRCRLEDDPRVDLRDLRRGARSMLVVDYKVVTPAAANRNLVFVVKGSRGRYVQPFQSRFGMGGGPSSRGDGWSELEFPGGGERVEVWIEAFDGNEARSSNMGMGYYGGPGEAQVCRSVSKSLPLSRSGPLVN